MPSAFIQRQIDRLLNEAEAALAHLDWDGVRAQANAILALDPENGDAQSLLEAAARASVSASSATSSESVTPATPSAPPLPSSFAGGRYAVRRFLGEGGRKRVYLAHDEKLKRDVAVAVIKTDGLDAQGLSRVQREAQAMAQLGDHANIVTIHDVGDDAGQPYIVSQYMSGGAVDTLEMPLPIERTLEIAKGVCRGLAHAHKHGVVHRDLKPGNVWIAADGTAEIGDFGLAVAFEQSRLTMHGMLVGTVAYMPPEQALGSEVTPRADLYSLGCMLYELITGKPPFTSDNPTAVISQHINTPPVAPSWLAEGCPQELEDIVLRLLAKDPSERPASADEVLAMLERVDPAGKAATHSDSNVLDRLALGVFVGRESELERLRKAFDNAVSGHGGLVMLVGEPGIGKTRTTQELETYAKMRGAQVLWGRTHESAGAPPYFPWLQAGGQYAAAHADDLPAIIGPQMQPDSIAELTRIFPWLVGPNVGVPEAVADPEVAQFRLFDAYTSYLKAIANQGPLVIALDDLHWADKPTLQLLQHIARELSRMRVLIVANYRDTDITRQSALSETLASLNRESGFDRIVLRGLSREEVGAYIKARANVEPRKDVLDRIFEETEGNAFFLSEVVNLMAQEGTLTKTSISDIAIPDGVREALGRRLNRLTEETNELLQIAAIIGRDFTYDTLTLLGDRDEDALLKMIEEALEARVIEETEQAGRYRFTHAQMQETLLAELSTTRRVRLHGQVGEALETRYGAHAEERAGRLAMHFAEAATLSPRFTEKAAKYSGIAGRQAVAQSAYPEAARHFRAALSAREGQAIDDDMAELLADYGSASEATLHRNEAWRSYRQAFEHYAQNRNVARAVDIAEHVGSTIMYVLPTQTRMVERALELVEEGSAEYGRLNAALGYSAGMLADDARAQGAFRRARDVAQRLGLKRLELTDLAAEMEVDMMHWRPAEQFAKAQRVIDLAAELNEPVIEGRAHWYAALNSDLALREEARAHADACMALAERLRLPSAIESASLAQGLVAVGTGDWVAARAAGNRGLEVNQYSNWHLAGMAEVERQQGNFNASSELGRRLVAVMDDHSTGLPHRVMTSSLVAIFVALESYMTGQPADVPLLHRAAQIVLTLPQPTGFHRGIVHSALGLQAALANDEQAARAQLQQLELFAGWWIFGLTMDHVRGLLLETIGQVEDAIEAIEMTLAYPQTGDGFRPLWSWAAYDCARIRIARDGPGDRERARTLIDEALGHAQKLGMRPLIDKLVALKMQDQGISTITDIYTSIDVVAESVGRERPEIATHAAPDGTVTIMFSDIEDSTVLTERLGDQAWQDLLRKHNALIREQLRAHQGYEVKTMGDGFMVAFQSAKKGLDCAIAIQRAFDQHNATNGPSPSGEGRAEHVKVRIGLHAGEVIKDQDDFYGKNVILASRVAGKAVGGEILVSSLLRQLVESSVGAAMFGEPREVELKGLSGTHTVYAVGAA
jgi:class 3 adenylate cyclase/Cdc6-like AAA superfamily ATPase